MIFAREGEVGRESMGVTQRIIPLEDYRLNLWSSAYAEDSSKSADYSLIYFCELTRGMSHNVVEPMWLFKARYLSIRELNLWRA